jgi:hypothetical protein
MKFAFPTVASVALLVLLAGCNGASSATNSDTSSNTPSASGASQSSDVLEVPADLKSDAYEYYGLGNKEESKFTITQNGKTESGTTRYNLTSVKDGKAMFELKNAGALAQLGTVELALSKDGIKTVKMENMTVDPESFELVAGLTPGKTWKFKVTLKDDSVLEGTNEVVGTQEVKTAVNTYKDALLIKSTVTGSQNGKPIKSNTQTWLVKGRGQVKTVIENEQDGKKTTSTIEESK